jgi:hypothetical protein
MTTQWLLYWFAFLFIPVVASLIVFLVVTGQTIKTKTFWVMMPIGMFVIVPAIAILLSWGFIPCVAFAVFWGWFTRRLAMVSDDQTHREGDVTSIFGKK